MREHEPTGYSHVTFMLSLPRSRSAWMAEFMRPFIVSMHNPLQQCASIDELGTRIDNAPKGRVFVSDVAALFFFEKLLIRFPGAKYLIVHRPAHEVEHSMSKLGVAPPINLRSAEKRLISIGNALRGRGDCMSGTFFELNSPEYMKMIARFVLGMVPPYDYYLRMQRRNVQVSIADQAARTDMLKQRQLFRSAKFN